MRSLEVVQSPLAGSCGLSEHVYRQKDGRPKDRPKDEEMNVGNSFDFSRVSPPWLSPQGHTSLSILDPLTGKRETL